MAEAPRQTLHRLRDGVVLARRGGNLRGARFLFVFARDRVLELPHPLAERAPDFRHALRPEDQENHDQEQDELRNADPAGHRALRVERFGRSDTYVANAMMTVYAEAHRLADEELRRVLDVNFFGGVYGYWASLPHLRDSQGTFVQIASALSYRGIPLQAAYCSSKAALRTFFETARVEQQKERSGVDISVILPGAINTPQFDRARQKMGLQPMPVPPIYQPEPFAEAVATCCENPVRE